MDDTTLVLAVDSTQVASAADALAKMTAASDSAASSVNKLTAASAAQGRAVRTVANEASRASAALGSISSKDKDGAAFVSSLQARAAALRKTTEQLTAMRVAQAGLADQTAPLVSKLGAASTATAHLGSESKKTLRDLMQLTKGMAEGNWSQVPMEAGKMAVESRLFAAAARAPMAAAGIGAVVASLGALAAAYVIGERQSEEFNQSLQLTGNYAGLTEGAFFKLTRTIAAGTGQTVGGVRDMASALQRTGEIGATAFAPAVEAATLYANAVGMSAEETAKSFAKMAQDPARWATETTKQLHILSAAQIESIRSLQEQGRTAEAQGIIFDALTQRFKNFDENLGTLGRTLKTAKTWWSAFWDAAFDVGRPQTIEDKIAETQKKIDAVQKRAPGLSGADVNAFSGRPTFSLNVLQREHEANVREKFLQDEAAQRQATERQVQALGIAANKWIHEKLSGLKTADNLKKALAESQRQFESSAKAAAATGTAPTFTAEQKRLVDQSIRDSFKAAPGPTDKSNQAKLTADLKALKDALELEQDAIRYAVAANDIQYKLGTKSLAEYYDTKRDLAAKSTNDRIAELEQEKAVIKAAIDREADPARKISQQSLLGQADHQQAKLRREAAHEVLLANHQQAESFKSLNEKIVEYSATLFQLQGDETGAARLRRQLAVDRAQTLAIQAAPTPHASEPAASPLTNPIDVAAYAKAIDQQIELNDARSKTFQINQRLQIEESRIALAATTGSLSTIDAMRAQGEARKAAVAQLEEQVVKMEEIAALAENSRDWKLQLDTQQARLEIDRLKASLDPLAEKFNSLFKDGTSNFLQDLMNGKKGLKGALKDFASSVFQGINKQVSEQITSQLFGKDGLFGDVGGILSSLFTGKKAGTNGGDSNVAALDRNVQTIDRNITALDRNTAALEAAANKTSLGGSGSATTSFTTSSGSQLTVPVADGTGSTGDFTRFDRAYSAATAAEPASGAAGLANSPGQQAFIDKLVQGSNVFGDASANAASSIVMMAAAASKGGSALSMLPTILQTLMSAMSTGAASGGGGGLFSWIGSLFTGASGGGAVNLGTASGADVGLMYAGALASGGPVNPRGLYRVNEFGPEVLEMNGRQFLMTGRESGKVRPVASNSGQGSSMVLNVNVTPPAGSSRETAMQWGATAGRHIQRSIRRNG